MELKTLVTAMHSCEPVKGIPMLQKVFMQYISGNICIKTMVTLQNLQDPNSRSGDSSSSQTDRLLSVHGKRVSNHPKMFIRHDVSRYVS